MRTLICSFAFILFSLNRLLGGGIGLPTACGAYVTYLAAQVSQIEPNGDCIPFEEMVVTSESWTAFVWNFERYFSTDGYPLHLAVAFAALQDGNDGKALAYFDAATSSIHQVFAKTDDRERAEMYLYLVVSIRNSMLKRYISGDAFWTELASIKMPSSIGAFDRSELEEPLFLQCLIRLDAWTLPIQTLLTSSKFQTCVKS